MYKRLDRAHRAMPLALGVMTLISLGVLLAWDVNPKFFPARAQLPFSFGLPINSGQIYPKRLSSTTLPLRSSSSMCFWS